MTRRAIYELLLRIEAKLDQLIAQEHTDMAALDDAITAISTSFNNLKTAVDTLITDFAAAGATPAQLAALGNLKTAIDTEAAAVQAALPASPTPTPTPTS